MLRNSGCQSTTVKSCIRQEWEDRGSILVLTSEPSAMTSQERGPMCQGNCVPLKRLAIYSSLIVGTAGRVKSNVVSYFTVLPSLCSLFLRLLLYRKWSVLAQHLMEISPWSNFVQVFCLIYSCAVGFGVNKQLESCPLAHVPSIYSGSGVCCSLIGRKEPYV